MADPFPRAAFRNPRRAIILLLIILTVIPAAASPARPDSAATPPAIPDIILNDVSASFDDAIRFFTSPLGFDAEDWNRTATGLGMVGVIMAMDEPLNALLLSHPPPVVLDDPLEWAGEWGRLRTMQYASLGIYFTGLLSGKSAVRVTGRLMGEALLLAGIPAITLQYGLGRNRPDVYRGAFRYNFFEWSNEYQSLPSGHATVAFAISTVLAKRIDRLWASLPLYAFAGCTALSMTWHNEHWPSDVVIGAVIGYLAGSHVVSEEERRNSPVEGTNPDRGGGMDIGVGPGGITLKYILFR